MPFIGVRTAQKLMAPQKQAVKEGLGQLISLIPGKSEEKLMIAIEDAQDLYFRGEEKASAAFVEVRLKDKAEFADKAKFTEGVFALLEEKAGIAKDNAYVNFLEFDCWGSRGVLK
jgi:phenylpyruvate tautomerase PptA (4-oxalocrotonate tautomerase family)